jgi:hypothetical protein
MIHTFFVGIIVIYSINIEKNQNIIKKNLFLK